MGEAGEVLGRSAEREGRRRRKGLRKGRRKRAGQLQRPLDQVCLMSPCPATDGVLLTWQVAVQVGEERLHCPGLGGHAGSGLSSREATQDCVSRRQQHDRVRGQAGPAHKEVPGRPWWLKLGPHLATLWAAPQNQQGPGILLPRSADPPPTSVPLLSPLPLGLVSQSPRPPGPRL